MEMPSDWTRCIQFRLLTPSDVPVLKVLCADWFPIRYPDSWYKDITGDPRFHSLAATYCGSIIGFIVSEVKPKHKCSKEDSKILSWQFNNRTDVAYILSLGVIRELRGHGIGNIL
ncbi:DgyrCDS5418 [Dimorphilus gyrociliatus]|uniref:N-alpha-acetyltransferase 60 n=1 Tax=Dimorphilus gyrociliatus TaxID=2664684 RepID=A0A7I8VMI1_9ANNE|nr:DgyrCDS5418 [Dimorphilus gyrociliatus]